MWWDPGHMWWYPGHMWWGGDSLSRTEDNPPHTGQSIEYSLAPWMPGPPSDVDLEHSESLAFFTVA
jgi:hypothetical protein